ncbi:hypothetical protein ABID52_000430 [Fictibacillus halophilus]|uniref:DUF5068 domain-containing protein n=1 Tax=Fictibacillus halophilus TaxID=1610490 RepID=A0ABV2LFI9_9BACL|nr:DUF5068 domain-containing protein [Fictibacillus halophilus]
MLKAKSKSKFVVVAGLSAVLMLSGCGDSEKASGDKEEKEVKVEEKAKAADEPKKEEKNEEKKEEPASGDSGEVLNPYIEEDTGGKVEVLYTNSNPGFVNEGSGFKVTIDEYQLVKVTGMNESTAARFDDSPNGYILTARMSVDNQSGKDVYFNGTTNIRLTDNLTYIPSNTRNFIEEGKGLRPKTYTEGIDGNTNMYKAGEKTSGLITFMITEADYQTMTSVKPKFVIEASAAPNKDFSGMQDFMQEKIFDFAYSGEQAKASASEQKFYPDLMSANNLADKKMIFEKTGIGQKQTVGDMEVTLEGVQYTEVIPTAGNESRFEDAELVALTVKTMIKNNGKKEIDIYNVPGKVTIDKDRGSALSNAFAEPRDPKSVKPGEEKEKYTVFLFRKDEFQLFKSFDLEVGPFFGDGKYLFGEKKAKFTLPR